MKTVLKRKEGKKKLKKNRRETENVMVKNN